MVPPRFLDYGSKLREIRVLLILGDWLEMAKNRGEGSENDPHFGNGCLGGPNGKVVAPDIQVICPVDKKRDSKIKKNGLLAPNIQIFGSKLHIFISSAQLELHRSMFSTQKRRLIGSLI